jgi:coproporphyrinogen III oxidase-like Fe-S oxidoreductase
MIGSGETAGGEMKPRPPVALYVHVPFCLSLCPYCDFVVVAGSAARGPRSRIAAFLAALEAELHLRADALDERWEAPAPGRAAGAGSGSTVGDGTTASRAVPARAPLRSLYLGGGTPSLLPADAVTRIIALVRERYGLAADAEVTIEVNPGPDERGDPAALRAAGITRLSIGAQSLDPADLRAIGRRHCAADVGATVAEARAAGIPSIGLDLLYDIPGASVATWAATIEEALALGPDHLSLYALTLDDPEAEGLVGPVGDHLPTTPGARRWRERARRHQDEDRAAAMYELADRRLASAGLAWYEISNWARPGHRSRHNLAYWRCEPYEAVGPGAHAFDGTTRRWNAARLDAYLAALTPAAGARPTLPPGGAERLDTGTGVAEAVILALRTSAGVPLDTGRRPPLSEILPWALDARLLETTNDRILLTRRGRLLSNEVFSRLV